MRRSSTNGGSPSGKPRPRVLREIVRRVVEVAQPERIILFGSAARGTMGPNSDVDLLVVKSGRCNRSRLIDAIYRNMHGAGEAIDVIVVTPEDVQRYRDSPCMVIYPAVREGKLVYAAKTVSSNGPARMALSRSSQPGEEGRAHAADWGGKGMTPTASRCIADRSL